MKLQPSIVVELIHIHGPMKGSIQEFSDGYISIGRHPSSSVCFPSKDLTSVSRKHAEITREGNQFKLIDHSTNGTFLNGRKVTESYLKNGDVLEFSEGGPKVSFITKVVELTQVNSGAVAQSEDLEVVREEVVLNTPIRAELAQSLCVDENISKSPAPSQSPPAMSSSPQPPVSKSPEELPACKVSAPLVIQLGPSIRTYRELPVTIGSNPTSDFVIIHPYILGKHAQIVFARNQYWIKDLTGQNKIRVNNIPIPFQAPLNVNDLISLSPEGPAFSFLGEGRFAEVTEPAAVTPSIADTGSAGQQEKRAAETAEPEGLWAKLKKRF